jgi:hypothetical protein
VIRAIDLGIPAQLLALQLKRQFLLAASVPDAWGEQQNELGKIGRAPRKNCTVVIQDPGARVPST